MFTRQTWLILAIAILAAAAGGWLQHRSRLAYVPAGVQVANVGDLRPDLALPDPDGQTHRLSDYSGRRVLLNFWATWCEPCKIEMPWLVDLQKKYRPQGLEIVGVAMDDSGEKTIADFAHKMQVNYTVLVGSEKVAQMYGGLDGLPTSFFLGRDGKVVDTALGLVSESTIEDAIKKSLATSGGSATRASAQ